MGPTLDALEASFRDFGILGQRPLAPAADVVATLSTNISGLDQRLAAVSASLTADHDALAANQASLAALGTSLDAVAVRLESGSIQSTISDIRTVLTVVLLMFVVWSAIPAVGALAFGLWLRREVRRGGATPPAAAPPAAAPPAAACRLRVRTTLRRRRRRQARSASPTPRWRRAAAHPCRGRDMHDRRRERRPFRVCLSDAYPPGRGPAGEAAQASDMHPTCISNLRRLPAAHECMKSARRWAAIHRPRPARRDPRAATARRGASALGQVVSQR